MSATVRLEAHKIDGQEYSREQNAAMHAAMEGVGCLREFLADDNRFHRLPEAEYRTDSLESPDVILQRVMAAIKPIWDNISVVVTGKDGGMAWYNLPLSEHPIPLFWDAEAALGG